MIVQIRKKSVIFLCSHGQFLQPLSHIHIVFLLTYLNCFIHLTYTLTVCLFFTETGLEGVYLISHALSTPKTTFNKCMYELACQYS